MRLLLYQKCIDLDQSSGSCKVISRGGHGFGDGDGASGGLHCFEARIPRNTDWGSGSGDGGSDPGGFGSGRGSGDGAGLGDGSGIGRGCGYGFGRIDGTGSDQF
jgi:hypothetical protein